MVLARADTYEGFERPALDDARVPELAAARDIDGLRTILIRLARTGVDGYDLVGLGEQLGSAWELLGFDVADRQGRSAIVHTRGSDHPLFATEDEAQAFLQASGGTAVVPVQRLDRAMTSPGRRVWSTIGNEHNPTDPFGRIVLTIDEDDHGRVEHFPGYGGGGGTWTGDVPPGFVDELRAELDRGGDPDALRQPIPPDGTIRQIEIVTDDVPRSWMFYDGFARKLDGYKEACALLDGLAHRLSGGVYPRGAD